jgi:predicted Zn-dependent protease with MMP-like domain
MDIFQFDKLSSVIQTSDEEFEKIVSDAIDAVPELYQKHLNNVAFIIEDQPSSEQRKQLGLHCDQLLFGLYEGVPLTARGGATRLLPDKITIFKIPIETIASSISELKDQVGRTVWHEVAHYYGLDHKRIHSLERKKPNKNND